VANLKRDEVFVARMGADANKATSKFKAYRGFLPSYLENHLRFRIGIHEYYVDRASVRVNRYFNRDSSQHTNARETAVRLAKLPFCITKRLVGKNEN